MKKGRNRDSYPKGAARSALLRFFGLALTPNRPVDRQFCAGKRSSFVQQELDKAIIQQDGGNGGLLEMGKNWKIGIK